MDSTLKRTASTYERFWEILPAGLEWSTFVLLIILSWRTPLIVSYFIILFSLYWLVKSAHVSLHLIHTYRRLKAATRLDRLSRLQELDDPRQALLSITAKLNNLLHQKINRRIKKEIKMLRARRQELLNLVNREQKMPRWRDVWHIIILTTYDEPTEVLAQSIAALEKTKYPLDRVLVIVGLEERAGKLAKEKALELQHTFKNKFAHFWTITHPDGLVGEAKVKSANAAYALKQILPWLRKNNFDFANIIVSNLDADTQVAPNYLACLTEAFIVEPDRQKSSFQPIPFYHNNYWSVPMLSRVSAIGSTFWQMIEASRVQRLISFSSHALPLKAIIDVGGWDVTRISEDSRIFWQCCVKYQGRYKVVPLLVSVSMDAVQADTWWHTLVNLYKQKRRWAWGAENLAYLGTKFFSREGINIPLKLRLLHTFRMIEGFYTWGTAAIILAIGGWLPGFLGGDNFNNTVLGQNFLSVSRFLLTFALLGVFVSIIISYKMVPPRPANVPKRKILSVIFQWVLTPVITIVFGSIPALDAHTRLMLGRYMEFQVMPKVREKSQGAQLRTEKQLEANDAF